MMCPPASSFQMRDVAPLSDSPLLSLSSTHPQVKIRVGVSLGVLFDLSKIILLRERCGEKALTRYLRNRINEPLPRGPGLAAFAKMARFNKPEQEPYFEFYILSDLSPEIAARTQLSIPLYGLNHGTTRLRERGLLDAQGKEIVRDYTTENTSLDLVLSTRKHDVLTALENGIPAGYVDPRYIARGYETEDFVAGLDLDRSFLLALGDPSKPDCYIDTDEYYKAHGLEALYEREKQCCEIPAHPGPVAPYFLKLFAIREKINADDGLPNLRLPAITARTKAALERAEKALAFMDVHPDGIISTGYGSKGQKATEKKVDFFCDDNEAHVAAIQTESPNTMAVHVPWTPKHIDSIREMGLFTPVLK